MSSESATPVETTSPADEMAEAVARLRQFNRVYTRRIGVLEGLESELSLPSARLLYEIGRVEVCTASDLVEALTLDPGYVSRLTSELVERGLVEKSRCADDGRRRNLRLGAEGERVYARLCARADREMASLLEPLDAASRGRLLGALDEVESLLGGDAPGAQVRIREHGPGDLGWVLQRHAELYREGHGFDQRFEALVAKILADFALDHDARRERLWIADAGGRRLGSIMLVADRDAAHDDGADDDGTAPSTTARLRLFLVEPQARGRGVGGRLMATLFDFARRRGYRSMVLSTVDRLHAARHLYERAGFRRVRSWEQSDWSVPVREEDWLLESL